MNLILKIEELALFLLGIYFFNILDFSWWWFIMLLLTPDIGMLGYLINTRIGAITYNVLHHRGVAVLFYLIGIYTQSQTIQLIGVIIFCHAALDRVFGYGLKYFDHFKHTHLGDLKK
ncbi:DUF4260 domain-containing protein [Snuella sedimenti]|uniref:DUF4260 domain-containing protein n=1 Tax=Snuella sedimenti TaxID=2798802 RepID=A0A8J7IH81_9FLAO|nr:DUF4260 domain-containing protein [Snuella sedimenti]MBJ6367741.1 DUF4260 domain-containing protein [Snuella sedimenti]